MTLWGNHTNAIDEGATYLFNNVRVKATKDEKYVNTPNNEEECTIEPVEAFTESLPEVEVVKTMKEMIVNILGVTNATKVSVVVHVARRL